MVATPPWPVAIVETFIELADLTRRAGGISHSGWVNPVPKVASSWLEVQEI
jgi:hypothetical protein